MLAAALGALVAWFGLPAGRTSRDLRDVGCDDPLRRAAAWDRLLRATASGPPRAASLLDAIHARLAQAGDPAVLEGADALRRAGLWTWDVQPRRLTLRELDARLALGAEEDLDLVLSAMEGCPLDLEPRVIIPLAQRLIDAGAGERALDAVMAWAGPQRAASLLNLSLQDHPRLTRRAALAQAVAPVPPPHPLPEAHALAAEGLDLAEAHLMWHAWASREDARDLLRVMRDWPEDAPAPPFASLLRYSRDPRASERLEQMARADDEAAAYALQAASPRDEARARAVLARPDQPAWLRRMAAWRWPDIPPDVLADVLASDPAEADGSVFAAVLLAEGAMARPDAERLAESWMRDFDDDRKRAGALLAALLGAHGELLVRAERDEDVARVRRAQRMAILVQRGAVDELVELAHRTPDAGGFDADALLCLLASGHAPAALLLGSPPAGDWRLAVQQRSWLVQRFLPQWHQRLGRPIGADARGLLLHFELLRAVAVLECRRLRFDPGTRTFATTAP